MCFECVHAHTLHVKVRGGFRHLSHLPLKLFSWERVSHLCVCLYVHVCMEVRVHLCGSQRFLLGVFLNCLHLTFLRQGFSWTWKLTGSARLTGWQAPGICLAPPAQHWAHSPCFHTQHFLWVLEIWAQVLMLGQEAFYPLSHFVYKKYFHI